MKKIKPSKSFQVRESVALMDFLEEIFPDMPRTRRKQMLRNECVLVDGLSVTKHDFQLSAGNQVSVVSESKQGVKVALGLSVIFEDHHLIVIDKPAGLLTVGTEKEKTRTAYSLLSSYVKTQNRNNKVFIVHRLDRDTSGVLVFARNTSLRDELQQNWHGPDHVREYAALVSGKVDQSGGTVESWLKENANLQVFSSNRREDGQHAITHWKLERQNDQFSLLKVTPETGRRNQIRVHMSDIGHPIVGDRRYGDGANPIGRLGLHATRLAFQHPLSGEILEFKSSIPRDFINVFHFKRPTH